MKKKPIQTMAVIAGLIFFSGATVAAADPGHDIRLGREALTQEHPDLALSYFRKARDEIRRHPDKYHDDQLAALSGLGYAALWVGNSHEAENAYSKGITIARSPGDQKTMRVGLARALINLGRPREAYDILKPVRSLGAGPQLQSAIASALLSWDTIAWKHLDLAAPHGVYPGPQWQAQLFRQTSDFVYYPLHDRINVGYQYSSDSDHNINQTYQAGVTIPGVGPGDNSLSPTMWYAGFRQMQINDSDGQIGLSTLEGGWSAPINTNWNYSILGGVSTARNWTFGRLAGQLNYQPSDSWGLNLSFDRQPIRTVTAVENKILVNTVSLGGFGRLRNIGTVGAAYFHQAFSDGNQRDGVVVRVTPEFYSFSSLPISVGVQGYFRAYTSGTPLRISINGSPTNAYFSPHHYREALGYIIYVQKFSPYSVMRLYAGYGDQTIDGITTPITDFYGTITGIVSTHLQFSLTGGYSQVASAYGGGAGYHRSYVGANLTIPF
ncbi:hypothetical protein H7F10_10135 [Acidithiobacillus sp. HP-6]|uniref:tetratricopeptide repeat protein n=1 Tax=unclassified Acidithiobacillus TaxID=2614800 RepID=UPI00187AF131|nr:MULTISPECIES: hypothetical protein [unclassified Acidithiobacillus]MBE7563297.1 hypothetical protein [Acidithiobacillus sp. HP-6]MBE7571067.1 hypothetical protein [Acidithiobacillus sp. HP-2]